MTAWVSPPATRSSSILARLAVLRAEDPASGRLAAPCAPSVGRENLHDARGQHPAAERHADEAKVDHEIGEVREDVRVGQVEGAGRERRRGLARRLIRRAIDWSRRNGFSTLWLHASKAGRPIYASMGFVPTNEMKLQLR